MQSQILLFLALVAAAVVVLAVKKGAGGNLDLKYRQHPSLFSPAELSFYRVLDQVVADRNYIVFAKIRVADVLKPSSGLSRSNWGKLFAKISSKHFDFVIYDLSDFKPVVVVELDDSSHSRKDRVSRDRFLDEACLVAGLRMVRVKAKKGYALQEIDGLVFSSEGDAIEA